MKATKRTMILVGTLFLMSTLTACMGEMGPMGEQGIQGEQGPQGEMGEQGVQGKHGDTSEQCTPDVWTLTLQTDYIEAEFRLQACRIETETAQDFCNNWCETKGEDESCYDDCEHEAAVSEWHCRLWYAKHVNLSTVRQCGLEVFTLLDDIDPEVTPYEYPYDVSVEDFDGDGIRDWWELQMGLNPCTQHSLSNCLNDGDLDYDVDGIPNKDDEMQLCNPDDPAGMQIDCV
ncbi:collagen-like protein [Candidatus Peregrinibacteria bacterium]|nr:collagen-like protein [Candidatus Peregrinibacteria bacterium]MBT7736940.1 collagen-like protein [Candidatus Peregrinibacteria bacterium]